MFQWGKRCIIATNARAGFRIFWLALAVSGLAGRECAAFQSSRGGSSQDAAIEAYLIDRDLTELLVVHLRRRLSEAPTNAERLSRAERLGKIYAQSLNDATTPQERKKWDRLANELLGSVPEADSFELRVNLAKVNYLVAEEIAERVRLELATAEEAAEAERILRDVGTQFHEIGTKVNRFVKMYELREERASVADREMIRAALADSRRLRSLAMYYAGWSNYYLAFLTDIERFANAAVIDFGWVLSTGKGRPASLERLPKRLLRYEHISRAAIGAALCASIRGNDVEAEKWLDAVEAQEELPSAVRDQLFSRRLIVYAAARRWADIERLVRRKRRPDLRQPIVPLDVAEARLLAVLMLQVAEEGPMPAMRRDIVQALADNALADLVVHGEVGHILDLVSRYGTTPIGDDGFIVHYVRGLHAYERARDAHKASGSDPDAPVTDAAVINRYREAADMIALSLRAEDTDEFEKQLTKAGLMYGLSLFYADDLVAAADAFEAAAKLKQDEAQAQEALWLAVVALDRAVDQGLASLTQRRDRLAVLYLHEYPRGERATRLLLRQATSGLMTAQEAVAVLLALDESSDLYLPARRHAARLLYTIYRKAGPTDRDFAATRFIEIADEVLAVDRSTAIKERGEAAQEAKGHVLALVRQILDAALSMLAPDLERADSALGTLESVVVRAGLDVSAVAAELAYRRFQIALAREDSQEMEHLLDELHAIGGRYADSADRLVYRLALASWLHSEQNGELARQLIESGSHVMTQFGVDSASLNKAGVASVYNHVADAAMFLWETESDEGMRDLALRADTMLIDAGRRGSQVLWRHARLSEVVGDTLRALEDWRTLMAGTQAGSAPWFEARYHSLRLLAMHDPQRATRVMAQHKALHPSYGPEPWGDRLRELESKLVQNANSESDAPDEGRQP